MSSLRITSKMSYCKNTKFIFTYKNKEVYFVLFLFVVVFFFSLKIQCCFSASGWQAAVSP